MESELQPKGLRVVGDAPSWSSWRNGTPTQRKAFGALVDSRLMTVLADFDPIVAGTIPIDVDIPGSDLDVICCCDDLDQFELVVSRAFGNRPGYHGRRIVVDELPTSVIRFRWDGLPIELFAQDRPSDEQPAVRHRIVEGRLLDLIPSLRHSDVRRLKREGRSTEEAFAELLELSGDPYRGLYDLSLLSDTSLQAWIESRS